MNCSRYLKIKEPGQKDLNIGIAVPCHFDDKHLLTTCLTSIHNLSPKPYMHTVDVNRGEGGLKAIRTRLFNNLFERGCNVVLSCDVDFYLFPDILHYVKSDKVVNFCCLQRRPIDVTLAITRRFARNPWCGCYSLPRQFWEAVRNSDTWDGSDESVAKNVYDYEFIYSPKYFLMRRSDRTISFGLGQKGLFKKIKWLALHGW